MSINTDCRTISDTTLTKEYGIMEKIFNWKEEHFLKCNLEAIAHSFCSKDKKEKLAEKLISGFA
jgi:adenosine deaminase